MTYTPLRSDVSYLVESSTDLINWSSGLVNQGTFISPSSPVTASIPMLGNTQLFLRLEITYSSGTADTEKVKVAVPF